MLWKLAKENNLWYKRIAVVSTMYHVKKGEFKLMKALVLYNMNYAHDLIHKANGWLLREMGKQDEEALVEFLRVRYSNMLRTTLRYAIERLDEAMRQNFLKGNL